MTMMLKTIRTCAAAAGLLAVVVPQLAFADTETVQSQPATTTFDAAATGAAATTITSPAFASSLQAVASGFGADATVVASLGNLSAALQSAGPGTPQAAQAVSEAVTVMITPALASNPPDLGSATQTAVDTLKLIVTGLTQLGTPVPPALAQLTATLEARL